MTAATISLDEWRARGRSCSLLAHRIFYVDTATDKPPLLLIHGFPTSSWDWAPIWAPLAERYRLIAPDMLGFGFSAKPKAHRYSILEQADLCEALVRELGLAQRELHVLAHDYGDTVAQELLARHTTAGEQAVGRWRSLCLLNGGLFPETHRPRPIQKLLLSPLGPLASRLSSRRVFGRSFSAVFGPDTKPSEAELDEFWRIVSHEGGARVTHLLIHYMAERIEHRERWVGALRDTQLPLCLINGSLDPVSGAHMIARYREVIGEQDEIVALARVGHYPQVEAPEQVLEAYLGFLVRAEARGPRGRRA